MIAYYHRTLKGPKMNTLDEPRAGVFVVAESPTEKELETLAQTFDLDIDLLTDAIDPYEAPRLESDAGTTYIYTRTPIPGARNMPTAELSTIPVALITTTTAVLAISAQKMPFIEQLLNEKTVATTQKVKLVLQVLETITRLYYREINAIRKDMRRYYVNPEQVSEKDVVKFITLESRLTDYVSALTSGQDVFSTIEKGKHLQLHEEDTDLVEDLSLLNDQLIGLSVNAMRTVTNLRELYAVVATNKLNRVIRLLTVLTVVLTIPTIVTSFFGMNVPLPLAQSSATWLLVAGGSIGIAALLIAAFRMQRWI